MRFGFGGHLARLQPPQERVAPWTELGAPCAVGFGTGLGPPHGHVLQREAYRIGLEQGELPPQGVAIQRFRGEGEAEKSCQ